MKKVGVITMHRPINVGCYLQAYALQEAIIRLGYDCEIIDYNYPNKLHRQSTLKNKIARLINRQLKRFLGGGAFELSEQRFHDFLGGKYILSKKKYETMQELCTNPPDYDLYCVGSDQVWNPEYIQGDTSFFCNFAPSPKPVISYASSFGVTRIPSEFHEFYRKCLNRFEKIAVRECSGIDIIKDLTGKNAQFVVDPTLLFRADEWEKKIPVFNDADKYILCYGTPYPNKYIEKLALHIQRSTGYKIIYLFGLPWQRFDKRIEHVFDVGPLEFLSWIKNATLVLTTSFHGTIFSANFNVPFYSVYFDKEGGSRLLNILEQLDLLDRGVPVGSEMPTEPFLEMNFKKVNRRLNQMRESSWEYLKEALSVCD